MQRDATKYKSIDSTAPLACGGVYGKANNVACVTRNQREANASFNTLADLIPLRYIRALTTGILLLWGFQTPTVCRASGTCLLRVRRMSDTHRLPSVEDVRHAPVAERRALAFRVFEMTRGRGFAPNERAANEWMRGPWGKGWLPGFPGSSSEPEIGCLSPPGSNKGFTRKR